MPDPQIQQLVQNNLTLSRLVTAYRQKVWALELEILTIGNLLIERSVFTQEEVMAMQKRMLEKHGQRDGMLTPEDELVQIAKRQQRQPTSRNEYMQAQEALRQDLQRTVARGKQITDAKQQRLRSARLPPTGHNDGNPGNT
jgi:hypothetical protein